MVELIEQNWSYQDGLESIESEETDKIRALLLGHKVNKIADDHLQLDDGTVFKIVGNSGCICESGDYELTDLNEVDNIITAVTFNEDPAGEMYPNGEGIYEVFVVAEDKYIRLLAVEGTDGNGYYGTGYTILVRR